MLHVFLLAAVVFIASAVKVLSGFGMSTILVPILALFLPFDQVLLFTGVLHLLNGFWQVVFFRLNINLRLLLYFGVPGIITSFVGALYVKELAHMLIPFLGLFLMGHVFFLRYIAGDGFFVPRPRSLVLGGGVSGFAAGLLGIQGPVRGAFLSGFDLSKNVYLVTLACAGFFIDLVRIPTYLYRGTVLKGELFWLLLVMIPIAFLGAYGARLVVHRMDLAKFRLVVALFLFVLGLKLFLSWFFV